MTYDFILVI